MKKFWIVLASLALMAAFAMPASAVEVKFSGEYYVAGEYYNRVTPGYTATYSGTPPVLSWNYRGDTPSTAFFRQRLRIQTEFIVSPGLSLVTRFDALERIWGDNHWSGSRGNTFGRNTAGFGFDREQENIEFEQAYIQYAAGKAGNFIVGYAPYDTWGTTFGDSNRTAATIQWSKPFGNWTVGALYVKMHEGSTTYKTTADFSNDNDDNTYALYGKYANDKVDTGLKVAYRRIADNKGTHNNAYSRWEGSDVDKIYGWLVTPYFKGQFGPVKLQAEAEYFHGKSDWNNGGEDDFRALSAYADAQVAIGPAYIGGLVAYASGQNQTGDTLKGTNVGRPAEFAWGGVDFKPTLILWNEDVCNWAGDIFYQGPGMRNAKLFQLYAGATVKDFDFKMALSYARANKSHTRHDFGFAGAGAWDYDSRGGAYGWELDGTVTYNITNNLSYMVGAGYLWTGDYFKPAIGEREDPKHIYVVTNKLTLTF